MNRRMEYGEREINLLHLLCYMLERYKSLIAVLVIGVILGLGAGMLTKSHTSTPETVEVEEQEPTEDVKQEMEIAASYRNLYEQQKEYNKNSIIMQLNPNNMYEGKVTYYLAVNGDDSMASETYTALLEDEKFLEELAGTADMDVKYIREIINAYYSRSFFNEITNDTAGVLTYSVVHYNEGVCQLLLEQLMKQVETYQLDANVYQFEKIADSLNAKANDDYIDSQNSYLSKENNYYNAVVNQEKQFTEADLAYYQTHYLNKELTGTDNTAEGNTAALGTDTTVVAEDNTVKYMLVGAIGAFFIWGMFWGVKYLFDNKIHTKEELENRYGIPVIGHVCDENKKKALYNRWKKYTYDSAEYLGYTLGALDDKGVVVCGLSEMGVSGEGIYSYADYFWRDISAMEKAKEIGNVVIGVKMNETTLAEVEREIDMCMVQNINVLGMIVQA